MSRGNIINCFFTGIRLSGYQSYGGGICGKGSLTTSSTIQNCYIECAMSSQKSAGTIIGLPGKVTADYCFYKYSPDYGSFGSDGGTKKLVRSYNDDFITNIDNLSVLEKLNEWVDDNATHYPELYRWKQGDTASPAVFIK